MDPSPTRPDWGWTPPARRWFAGAGVLAALAVIALGGDGRSKPAPPRVPQLVVDPSTAPPAVLSALPHVGPTLVQRIVAAREQAPFRSLDDFDRRVRGIGPATLASLRPFLRFEPLPAPTDTAPALAAAQDAGMRVPASAIRTVRLARTP
jgi:competence protein ComEA